LLLLFSLCVCPLWPEVRKRLPSIHLRIFLVGWLSKECEETGARTATVVTSDSSLSRAINQSAKTAVSVLW